MSRLYLCLVWCCLLVVGCGGVGGSVQPWACSEMVQLSPDDPFTPDSPTYDPASQAVTLFSCLNETVSFQLIIDAGPLGAHDVQVSIPGLVNTQGRKIEAAQITFYEMSPAQERQFPAWYIRLTDQPVKPTAIYDRLSPLRTKGLNLKPNERLALWVDVKAAGNAEPGSYSGPITITSGQTVQRMTLRVKVYDVALPQEQAVTCLGGFSHEQVFQRFIRRAGQPYLPTNLDPAIPEVRQGLDLIRGVIRVAHEHGLDLYDASFHPPLRRNEQGEPLLRWEDYDNFLKPLLDGTAFEDRQGLAAWPAPISPTWPNPADYGGRDTALYKATMEFIIRQSYAHLQALEGRQRLFACIGPGEVSAQSYVAQSELARQIRLVAPEMAILSSLPPVLPTELSSLLPNDMLSLMDASAPAGQFLDVAQITRVMPPQKALAGAWLRPGDMPYVGSVGLEAWPGDIRSLSLAALKYGCRGILIPEAVELIGGGGLFYISDDPANPLQPTVRLKLLRRSLQDAKYIALLQRRHVEAIGQELVNVLVHYIGTQAYGDSYLDPRLDGWVRRGDAYVAAHRLLAEECLAAVHPEQVSNQSLMAQRVAWQGLRQQLATVRVEEVLSRFDRLQANLFRGYVQVDFFNEMLEPVGVTLQLLNLPAGWQSPQRTYVEPNVDLGRRGSLSFDMQGDNVATGLNARMSLPLAVGAQGQTPQPMPASLPLLLCPYADKPITVDGDLHDWPLRPGNTAADFQLIGQRGRQAPDQSHPRGPMAQQQSSVFAMQDEQFLYLAFRCEAPEPEKLAARSDNRLRMQQLLTMDEDLVEVLLDPGHEGRGPGDLYHVVVKSNAILIARRGVEGLSASEPWPADIRMAMQKQDKLWIVELAIPRKAFGERGAAGNWGINFSRFSTEGGQSSNWAGNRRYLYQPKYLGTMLMIEKDQSVPLETTRPAGG